jgi:16S rRNA (guanine527-N7)-methyltransferase
MKSLERLIQETLLCFAIDVETERVIGQLSSYVEELAKWNRRMNLTGLVPVESIIRDLLSDAIFLHTVIPVEGSVLDLGSGAGILAIPLAVLSPGRRIISVDKSLRKAQFQRHVKRLMHLSNVEVLHARAEDLPPLHVNFLVAKAFGGVTKILRKGGPHLMEGSLAFLVRGATEEAPQESGFVLNNLRSYQLPKSGKSYQLFVYKKVT